MHLGHFVCAVVVHHQMDVEAIRKIGFDVIEKPQEFLMPVPPVAVADGYATCHIHGRK